MEMESTSLHASRKNVPTHRLSTTLSCLFCIAPPWNNEKMTEDPEFDFDPLNLNCALSIPKLLLLLLSWESDAFSSRSLRQIIRRSCCVGRLLFAGFWGSMLEIALRSFACMIPWRSSGRSVDSIGVVRKLAECDGMRSIRGDVWLDFHAEERRDGAEVLTLW
jgi:hypothetical protein